MFGAYQRWCRTTSTRAQYFEKMLEVSGMVDDPECPKAGKHRELENSSIKKSEEAVQNTIAAIKSFTNPFTITDKENLYCISSGAPIPPDVAADVLSADEVGKKAKQSFIEERFIKGSSVDSFFEPIARRNLKSMEASHKSVKLTSSQGKV